jgi:hypothetical protein
MSVTNDFLPFCPNDTGTNLEEQAAYLIDTSRTNGNQPGVASSKLNNKALRQSTYVVSQLAQWMSNKLNQNVLDDATPSEILAQFYAALADNSSNALQNLAFTTSVGSSALTIALQTQLAATPSALDVIYLGMRSATATTGNFNLRSVTAATTLTVPSGATLGTSNGVGAHLYLYALDNAGTIALGIINGVLDEGNLQTSVAITSGATSAGVLYSTSALSNVPVRLIGHILITETTAGTWATNATQLDVLPFNKSEKYTQTATVNSVTSNTYVNVISQLLPRGQWRLDGTSVASAAGATVASTSLFLSGISAQVGTSPTDLNLSQNSVAAPPCTSSYATTCNINSYIVDVTTPTTFYLKSLIQYSAGTPQFIGTLTCTRILG